MLNMLLYVKYCQCNTLKKTNYIRELYKLLLYKTGGHFKAHRDTEKAEGMFGTLIVQLRLALVYSLCWRGVGVAPSADINTGAPNITTVLTTSWRGG